MQADEGGPRRQGRQGGRVQQARRLAVRPRNGRIRLVRQHGAHHEGAGPPRLINVFLHDVEEDHGGQPYELHRCRASGKGENFGAFRRNVLAPV